MTRPRGTSQGVHVRGIGAGTVFKILLVGFGYSIGPVFLLAAFLSLLGFQTIWVQGEQMTGVPGLLSGILLSLVFPIALAVLVSLPVAAGLWLHFRFAEMTVWLWPARPIESNGPDLASQQRTR